jgi:hypothetical protein
MKKFLRTVCAGLLVVSLAAGAPLITGDSALADGADAVSAADTADALQALLNQYLDDGDAANAYLAARRLAELQPDNLGAYLAAADALLGVIRQNERDLESLLASAAANAPDGARQLSEWLRNNGMEGVVALPFVPDYTDESQINAVGNTAGNLTNALLDGNWRGGFVTTQAGWVYYARFTGEYGAIYKMRSDGNERQRVGTVHGYSLNVVGDWLYFANLDDGCRPYRMRTDGSGLEKLADVWSSFLSVSEDWVYSDGYGDDIALCRFRTDGSDFAALTDYPVISSRLYGDWIYFNRKSMENDGFLRIRADGTQTQGIVEEIVQCYAITDDAIYYVDPNHARSVMRCDPDGGNPEQVYLADDTITAMNVSGQTLIVAHGISFDKDGLTLSSEISLIDLSGGKVLDRFEAHTEPLCVGEGRLFYTEDGEGMRWHCMDLRTGEDIPME